jgi:hypothetical protein
MDGNLPEHPEPFYRRHGLAFAIATGVLALVVLLGGTAVGVFALTSVVVQATHSHLVRGGEVPRAPAPQSRERGVLRGTVASISGNTWRIETLRGGAVTVKITSSTTFGAPGSSKSANDFSAGDEVAVAGSRSGDAITATRVVAIPHGPQRPPSRPGSGDGG